MLNRDVFEFLIRFLDKIQTVKKRGNKRRQSTPNNMHTVSKRKVPAAPSMGDLVSFIARRGGAQSSTSFIQLNVLRHFLRISSIGTVSLTNTSVPLDFTSYKATGNNRVLLQ